LMVTRRIEAQPNKPASEFGHEGLQTAGKPG